MLKLNPRRDLDKVDAALPNLRTAKVRLSSLTVARVLTVQLERISEKHNLGPLACFASRFSFLIHPSPLDIRQTTYADDSQDSEKDSEEDDNRKNLRIR